MQSTVHVLAFMRMRITQWADLRMWLWTTPRVNCIGRNEDHLVHDKGRDEMAASTGKQRYVVSALVAGTCKPT